MEVGEGRAGRGVANMKIEGRFFFCRYRNKSVGGQGKKLAFRDLYLSASVKEGRRTLTESMHHCSNSKCVVQYI